MTERREDAQEQEPTASGEGVGPDEAAADAPEHAAPPSFEPTDADVDEIEDELEVAETEAGEEGDLEGGDESGLGDDEEPVEPIEDETVVPLGVEPAAPMVAATGAAVPRRRGVPAPAQRAPTQSELAVRVTDNASRFFVIGAVVVFVAIMLFGLLGGNNGFFTTTVPSAVPSESAAPSESAGDSGSPAASESPSPSS